MRTAQDASCHRNSLTLTRCLKISPMIIRTAAILQMSGRSGGRSAIAMTSWTSNRGGCAPSFIDTLFRKLGLGKLEVRRVSYRRSNGFPAPSISTMCWPKVLKPLIFVPLMALP